MAEAACERARALKPESAWVYSISSQLAEARGNLEEAIKWSDAALEHGSSIAAVQGERARWLVSLGEPVKAGAVYERAVAENAEAARRDAALTYGGCAAAVETGGAAGLRDFIRKNELDRSDVPGALFELANASLMVDDVAQAREYMNQAMASPNYMAEELSSPWLASGGTSYLLTLATIQRADGDAAGADKRLDELAVLLDGLTNAGVETYGLHYLKASLAAMRGNAEAAMQELNRAAQIGWRDAWLAERLPYFDSLRERPDYRELLAAVRAKNAATAAKLKERLTG
jgi:predicted Zn-dependent protease